MGQFSVKIYGATGSALSAKQQITGHKTAKMVQLYAGKARQKSRAKAANDAREQNKNRS
jgi:hypothetical protein